MRTVTPEYAMILCYQVIRDLRSVQTKTSRNLTSLQACMTVGHYCCHPVILANGLQVQLLILTKVHKSKQLHNLPESPIYWLPSRTRAIIERLLLISEDDILVRAHEIRTQCICRVSIQPKRFVGGRVEPYSGEESIHRNYDIVTSSFH